MTLSEDLASFSNREDRHEDKIAFALKHNELGTSVDEVCRQMGISEATFYVWKQKYRGVGPSEWRRLRQLEEYDYPERVRSNEVRPTAKSRPPLTKH